MEGGKKLGRDALAHLEVLGLCEECWNDCKMKAPKGSKLKCPNYKKISMSWRKIDMGTLRDQQVNKQERIKR